MFNEDDLFLDQLEQEEKELEEAYKVSENDVMNDMRSDWAKQYWPKPHKFSLRNPGFLTSHRLSISKDPRGEESFSYINQVNGYGECRKLNHVAYANAKLVRKSVGNDRFFKIHRWLSDQTYGLLYAPGVRFPKEEFEFKESDIGILRRYNMVQYRVGAKFSPMVITAPFVVKGNGKSEMSESYNYVEHASPILTVGGDTYAILLTTKGYRCIYLSPSVLDGVYHDVLEHHAKFDSSLFFKSSHFSNLGLVLGDSSPRTVGSLDVEKKFTTTLELDAGDTGEEYLDDLIRQVSSKTVVVKLNKKEKAAPVFANTSDVKDFYPGVLPYPCRSVGAIPLGEYEYINFTESAYSPPGLYESSLDGFSDAEWDTKRINDRLKQASHVSGESGSEDDEEREEFSSCDTECGYVNAWNIASFSDEYCNRVKEEGITDQEMEEVCKDACMISVNGLDGSNDDAIAMNNMVTSISDLISLSLESDQSCPPQVNLDNSVSNTVKVRSYLYPNKDFMMLRNDNGHIKYKGKVVAIDPVLLLQRLSSHSYLHSKRFLKALKKLSEGDVKCIRRMIVSLGYVPEKNGGWTTTDVIRIPRFFCARVFTKGVSCTCRHAMDVSQSETCNVQKNILRLATTLETFGGTWFAYDKN